jgi:hypothetical protein
VKSLKEVKEYYNDEVILKCFKKEKVIFKGKKLSLNNKLL